MSAAASASSAMDSSDSLDDGPPPPRVPAPSASAALTALVANSTTPAWRQSVQRARDRFVDWLLRALPAAAQRHQAVREAAWAGASAEDCRLWIHSLYDEPRPDLARGKLATQTVMTIASALDNARRASSLPPFLPESRSQELLRALKRGRPLGRLAPPLPRDTAQLVPFLPRDDSFHSLRLRALFGVRTAALLRPSAPLHIVLDSVAVANKPGGQPIVTFRLGQTKGSLMAARKGDSNHVEFLPTHSPNKFACPASNLIELTRRVCELADARRVPRPRSTSKRSSRSAPTASPSWFAT